MAIYLTFIIGWHLIYKQLSEGLTISVIIIEVDVLAASVARIEAVVRCKRRSRKNGRPLALFIVVLAQLILDAQRRAKFCLALITTVTEVKQSEYQRSQEERNNSIQTFIDILVHWLTYMVSTSSASQPFLQQRRMLGWLIPQLPLQKLQHGLLCTMFFVCSQPHPLNY